MRIGIELLSQFTKTLLCTVLLLSSGLAPAQAQGLLWEIKSPTNTIYLFGSIHLAKADFYPLPAAVEAAYAQADTLVVEADVTDAAASRNALPLMQFRAPDTLRKHVQPATWQLLESIAGPRVEQFAQFKPALVAVGLSMAVFTGQGYDPAYGIDLHFIERAKADRKKIDELESLKFQAGVLGGLSDAEGDALLSQTLKDFRDGPALLEAQQMISAWKSGDAVALAKLFEGAAQKDAGTRKLTRLLLDDRNLAMAEKISRMQSAGIKAFIVIGAGHLAGANSVTDILQKQGLQVRQIQ